MSVPATLESQLLEETEQLIATALAALPAKEREEAKYRILECVAARHAEIDPGVFRKAYPTGGRHTSGIYNKAADGVVKSLASKQIPLPLALTALARPGMTDHQRRKSGAFYTDFRLAQFLAGRLSASSRGAPKVIDPSSGTGILLVAATLALFPNKGRKRDVFLATSLFAADLSPQALRGAWIALASLASDAKTVLALAGHLRCGDSLLLKKTLWSDVAPDGFDLVLGNPPWEKLKITAHEVLREHGVDRHYGQRQASPGKYAPSIAAAKSVRNDYASQIKGQYFFQGEGEPDLYKFFLELSVELTRPGGAIAMIVPGGLIRSRGTHGLRRLLSESASDVSYTVLENRSRFFSIDTRFKFLLVEARIADQEAPAEIQITHARGTTDGIVAGASAKFRAEDLCRVRPDYSIPEVKGAEEWALFRDISTRMKRFGDPLAGWRPKFCREVDMTRDKRNFQDSAGAGLLPLIEGRMVHQFNYTAKAYVEGQGRSAKWRSSYFESGRTLRPQFWYPTEALTPQVLERVKQWRVGFCDITGQTNERSLLASWIPPGAVCGNKVPTILFDSTEDQTLLGNAWLTIANSLVFDWLLRRILTTTVNYFLLLDLPFPSVSERKNEIVALAEIGKRLSSTEGLTGWDYAVLRASAEATVASIYGVSYTDFRRMMDDFPLLDRAQPSFSGEERSTITRDLVSLTIAENQDRHRNETADLRDRVVRAEKSGMIPFVPSHLEES